MGTIVNSVVHLLVQGPLNVHEDQRVDDASNPIQHTNLRFWFDELLLVYGAVARLLRCGSEGSHSTRQMPLIRCNARSHSCAQVGQGDDSKLVCQKENHACMHHVFHACEKPHTFNTAAAGPGYVIPEVYRGPLRQPWYCV